MIDLIRYIRLARACQYFYSQWRIASKAAPQTLPEHTEIQPYYDVLTDALDNLESCGLPRGREGYERNELRP